MTREYEERIQELSDRLDHSESLIHAASEECTDRDEQITQLKEAIKQVSVRCSISPEVVRFI